MRSTIKALFLILAISTIQQTECSRRRRYPDNGLSYYTDINDALVSDSWWDNQSGFTQAAVVVGGIVSFYYVGKWIYNYFFSRTDAQEIEYALSQLEKDKVFHDQLAFAYHNECAAVMPMINIAIANKYTAHGTINLLRPEITGKYSNKPYYNYVINLERDIQSLESKKSDLSSLKIRLFERKMQLHKNNDKKMSAEEKAEYMREYNNTIEKISIMHDKFQNLHYLLHEIRNYVIKTHEYRDEEKQARIEKLERENAQLQSQAMVANATAAIAVANAAYAKPVEHTHITHVHIHQDGEDED